MNEALNKFLTGCNCTKCRAELIATYCKETEKCVEKCSNPLCDYREEYQLSPWEKHFWLEKKISQLTKEEQEAYWKENNLCENCDEEDIEVEFTFPIEDKDEWITVKKKCLSCKFREEIYYPLV